MSIKRRRISAFVLDMFLVIFLAISVCSLNYANPYKDSYQETYEEYNNIYQEVSSSMFEGGSALDDELIINELVPVLHKLQKYNIFLPIWYLVFYILYFVVFAYFNKGQTIGKKLFSLRVVDKDENKASILKMVIRSLFNGSSLYMGINIVILLQILCVFIKDSLIFYQLYIIFSFISLILEIVLIITFLAKKGDRALNDIIAGTKIISLK